MVFRLKIKAELKNWQFSKDKKSIEGTIHDSKDKKWTNGVHYIFLDFKSITQYPKCSELEEHFLVRTWRGDYFLCMGNPNEQPAG